MKNSSLIGLLVILYMLHDVPAISVIYPGPVFGAVTIGTFLLFLYSIKWDKGIMLLPFFLIPLFNSLLGFRSEGIMSFVGLIQQLIYPLAGVYVIQTRDRKLSGLLLGIFYLLYMATCITTSIGLQNFPNASRMQAMGDASERPEYWLFQRMNIGGFDFIYTLVVLFPICILMWQSRQRLFEKVRFPKLLNLMTILTIVLVYWTIVSSHFTTAFLLSTSCFVLLLVRRKLHMRRLIFISVVGLLFYSFGRVYIGDVLIYVSQNTDSEVFQERLNDLGRSIQGKVTEGEDFDERQRVWESSWNSFLNNPIGSWSSGGGIGGHSVWLDTLAKYGIIGLTFMLIMIRSMNVFILKKISDWKVYNCIMFVFFLFFISALVNPHQYFIVLLFLCPLFLYRFMGIKLIS